MLSFTPHDLVYCLKDVQAASQQCVKTAVTEKKKHPVPEEGENPRPGTFPVQFSLLFVDGITLQLSGIRGDKLSENSFFFFFFLSPPK